ncbi:hypothetical protein D3C77_417500 [compost metagenome]
MFQLRRSKRAQAVQRRANGRVGIRVQLLDQALQQLLPVAVTRVVGTRQRRLAAAQSISEPGRQRLGQWHTLKQLLLGLGQLCAEAQVIAHGMPLGQLAQARGALAVAVLERRQQHRHDLVDPACGRLHRGHLNAAHGLLPVLSCLLICRYQRSWWVLAQARLT